MRALKRPDRPANVSFGEYVAALVNEWGAFCSFCEKPLNFWLDLFRRDGNVVVQGSERADDWPDLFLACGDCIAATTGRAVGGVLWPDAEGILEKPFIYTLRTEVPFEVMTETPDAPGRTDLSGNVDLVLVQVRSGLDSRLASAAQATLDWFQLNGHHFNGDFTAPAVRVPYADYVAGMDQRPEQRRDVFVRAAEWARRAVTAYDSRSVEGALGVLERINHVVEASGYHSTWEAAIALTFEQTGTNVLAAVLDVLHSGAEEENPGDGSDFGHGRGGVGIPEGMAKLHEYWDQNQRNLNDRLDSLLPPDIDVRA